MGDFRKLKVWGSARGGGPGPPAGEINEGLAIRLRTKSDHQGGRVHPNDIVEGSRKSTNADFARFLDYALNSASELEYQLSTWRATLVPPRKT